MSVQNGDSSPPGLGSRFDIVEEDLSAEFPDDWDPEIHVVAHVGIRHE